MSAPGPGSRWRFRVSDRRRIPPVLRFWVIVTNLPPPVPRKTSSTPSMHFSPEDDVDCIFWFNRIWWLAVIRFEC
jgi:hypothetical protein